MCQSKTAGGRRCPESRATKEHRKLKQRLTRARQNANVEKAEALEESLRNLQTAKERYGNYVFPLTMDVPRDVEEVIDDIRSGGYNPLLVGGTVRDVFRGVEPKDFDIEVYGVSIDTLSKHLRRKGYRVDEVGKQFGVLKTKTKNGEELDISVPRQDSMTGAGHRGVEVITDEEMTVSDAALRRDFTMNAMMYDHSLKVAIDPYHGAEDLKNGELRHVSEAFGEDPLRPLRGFQFAARYGMTIAPETASICQSLSSRATELPIERIRGEWHKFYTKGSDLGAGAKALAEIGWEDKTPGLSSGTLSSAEGVTALRQAQKVAVKNKLSPEDRTTLIASTVASRVSDDHSAREFLNATVEGSVAQKSAFGLSRMEVTSTDDTSLRRAANKAYSDRISLRLYAAKLQSQGAPEKAQRILTGAKRLGILDSPQPNILMGKHVLETTDRAPGPWLGALVKKAHAAQEEGKFFTLAQAQEWLSTQEY